MVEAEDDPGSGYQLHLAQLRQLREAVGISWRGLARLTGVPSSTLENWLNGRVVPNGLSGLGHVAAKLLEQSDRKIAKNPHRDPGPDQDQDQDQHLAELIALTARVRQINWVESQIEAAGERAPELKNRAAGNVALRTILAAEAESQPAFSPDQFNIAMSCSPARLGVHPAIGGSSSPSAGSTFVIPTYFVRPHDVLLRSRLKEVAAGNSTELVILRGGSCTGKTRSAYEAVMECMADWQLVHPKDSATLVVTLASARISPRLVVWLDDLQNYLLGPHGEEAAAALRRHLERPGPGVIVATMWPEPYQSVVAGGGTPQAEALLRACTPIGVPGTFDDAQVSALSRAAGFDPSISEAVGSSRTSGAICQTLAAGPDLVDRWVNASNPYGAALITAAVDARRLGVRGPIPTAFMQDAAAGYLTAEQRAHAPSDWETAAWAYAQQEVKRVIAPILPVAAESGVGPASDLVTLAEFVEEQGRALRRAAIPPASFWTAVIAHPCRSHDTYLLATSARRRRYLRIAALLLDLAADAGDADAMQSLARVLGGTGRDDESREWLRRSVESGNDGAVADYASALAGDGDIGAASELFRARAEAGDTIAIGRLADALNLGGRADEAEEWWRRGADAGDRGCARQLARHLVRRGDTSAAEAIWKRRVLVGDDAALWELLGHLRSTGRADEVRQWWEQGVRCGASPFPVVQPGIGLTPDVAELVFDYVLDTFESFADLPIYEWLHDMADAGNTFAMRWLASELAPGDDEAGGEIDEDRLAEARYWLERAAEAGDEDAADELECLPVGLEELERGAEIGELRSMVLLAERTEHSNADRAGQLLRRAAADGYPRAVSALAAFLEAQGLSRARDPLLLALATSGDAAAATAVAEDHDDRGESEEAERHYRAAARSGQWENSFRLAEFLSRTSQQTEAERILREILQHDANLYWVDRAAELLLSEILRSTGREPEAESLTKYGLEPGGATSEPW